MDTTSFIPFHRPSIEQEEFEAVRRVLASGWLTSGREAIEFERAFAEFVGAKYAIAVNSATSALQLALDAIGLQPGDEVLVPTYTFTATAEVVVHVGGRPVLCDCEKGGFNLDLRDAARRISSRTKALIPVHLAGEPCDMTAVMQFARENGLRVIEDAAHALPASWAGKRIGSIGDLTAFSFYANKTITTGEGGMLTTDDPDYAARARKMRLHGISSDAWNRYAKEGSWYYEVEQAGFKFNMPDILAALGVAQLKKAERLLQARREIARLYERAFAALDEVERPPAGAIGSEHSWHLYILRLRTERLNISRNQFVEELKQLGIGTAVHYIPLHLHPFYRLNYAYAPGDFPQAEDAYSRCLSLPIYPGMTEQEVQRVIASVVRVVSENRVRVATVA